MRRRNHPLLANLREEPEPRRSSEASLGIASSTRRTYSPIDATNANSIEQALRWIHTTGRAAYSRNMNKLSFCLRRLPHLSREEFQRYWRETHAPLVFERASALGIRRYGQLHTRLDLDDAHARYRERNGGAPEPYDGIAELWFDLADRSVRSDAAKTAGAELLADERNFIDLPNSPMMLGTEHTVVAPAERRFLITTNDHDATVSWHEAIFDWPTVRSWAGSSGDPKGTLLAMSDGTRIEILQDEPDFPASPVGGVAVVVEVPDVDIVYTRAVSHGAAVQQAPATKPWGHRNVVLTDPNGLTVVAFSAAR
jgi:uncharacterized protein (TIGR02118 family)